MTDTKISRRRFLGLAGGSIALLAVGGVTYRMVDQGMFSAGQGPAYEPWQNWRNAVSLAERIVAAGILAANPHNSQPWLFRIGDATIDLHADPNRQIGVIDPFRRELYIGLGCALENMALAAAAEGFALWGATQGLAFQPLCQMCERVDREQQLGSQPVFGAAVAGLLGDAAWHAIMPFRIGYPTKASLPSPRRALTQVAR